MGCDHCWALPADNDLPLNLKLTRRSLHKGSMLDSFYPNLRAPTAASIHRKLLLRVAHWSADGR